MAHLKRQEIPRNWPVQRKGTTFIVKPTSGKGIPLLVLLRDILKVAQTRKELKKAIYKKNILVNNRIVKDEKIGLTIFDTISFVHSKKYYQVTLSEKGKFNLIEIKEDAIKSKPVKIINKRVLKGKYPITYTL